MKNSLKIEKIEKSQEEKLKEKNFSIEKAQLPEGEPIQCDKCIEEENFEFYDDGWFIEGEFYCDNHKEHALSILESIAQGVDEKRLEQERIKKERRL